jgi:hypothetical protein
MEQILLDRVKTFVGDRGWSTDLVLKVGVDLAQTVNSAKELSGKQKCELVCQTILKVLDDGEKVEIERLGESTDSEKTKEMKAKWEEYRNCVKTVLPVTLDLVISAARGQFDLGKAVQVAQAVAVGCLPWLSRIPLLSRFLGFLPQPTAGSVPQPVAASVPQPAASAVPGSKAPSPSPSPEPATADQQNAEPVPPKESGTQEELQQPPPPAEAKSESA